MSGQPLRLSSLARERMNDKPSAANKKGFTAVNPFLKNQLSFSLNVL